MSNLLLLPMHSGNSMDNNPISKSANMQKKMQQSIFALLVWFSLYFISVKLYIFQPHLHTIVNRSMELAMTAKEPYNYFLLLRALFRSIGGGSHDLLYQEFLPLLPDLLQGTSKQSDERETLTSIKLEFVDQKFLI